MRSRNDSALGALVESLNSVPSNPTAAHNHPVITAPMDPMFSSGFHGYQAFTGYTCMQALVNSHKIKINKKKSFS